MKARLCRGLYSCSWRKLAERDRRSTGKRTISELAYTLLETW